MQRRATTSIVLTLVLLCSLSFLPTARGQERTQKLQGDTGVIAPSTHQLLRVTTVLLGHNDLCGGKLVKVRFRWAKYGPLGCNNDGVCGHSVNDDGATSPVVLNAGESLSFDMHGTGDGIRVVVDGSCRAVRVMAQIIDKDTGKVVDAFDINVS